MGCHGGCGTDLLEKKGCREVSAEEIRLSVVQEVSVLQAGEDRSARWWRGAVRCKWLAKVGGGRPRTVGSKCGFVSSVWREWVVSGEWT